MRQLKITKQVTNRETASLDKYLQEIGKVELITADEEVSLITGQITGPTGPTAVLSTDIPEMTKL